MKKFLALLFVSLAFFLSSCTRNFEGNASSLMPDTNQIDSKFTLQGEETSSPFDGLGVKEKSYIAKTYSDTTVQYHSISFRALVYDKQDDAQYMCFVFSELLKKSENVPIIEDKGHAALKGANVSIFLYSIDTGSNDNYVRVWLIFNKNNVVGYSYAGGTGAKDDTNGALSRYEDEAILYAEIILSKIQ